MRASNNTTMEFMCLTGCTRLDVGHSALYTDLLKNVSGLFRIKIGLVRTIKLMF